MSQQFQAKDQADLEMAQTAVETAACLKTILDGLGCQRAAHLTELVLDQLGYDIRRRFPELPFLKLFRDEAHPHSRH